MGFRAVVAVLVRADLASPLVQGHGVQPDAVAVVALVAPVAEHEFVFVAAVAAPPAQNLLDVHAVGQFAVALVHLVLVREVHAFELRALGAARGRPRIGIWRDEILGLDEREARLAQRALGLDVGPSLDAREAEEVVARVDAAAAGDVVAADGAHLAVDHPRGVVLTPDRRIVRARRGRLDVRASFIARVHVAILRDVPLEPRLRPQPFQPVSSGARPTLTREEDSRDD